MIYKKGQSLVEFAIILGLVVLVAVMALTLLGGNINSMFASSKTKYEGFKPYGEKVSIVETSGIRGESSESEGGTDKQTGIKSLKEGTTTIGNTEITFDKTSRTASFSVGGQNIQLSSDVLSNLDTVFETSGSSGLNTYIVEAINDIINENKSKYPGQDVPVEISFGNSIRNVAAVGNNSGAQYKGNTAINQVSISAGNNIIVIVNDQNCVPVNAFNQSYQGVYRIDGSSNLVDKYNGNFSGKIKALQTGTNNNLLNGLPINGVVGSGAYNLNVYSTDAGTINWSLIQNN